MTKKSWLVIGLIAVAATVYALAVRGPSSTEAPSIQPPSVAPTAAHTPTDKEAADPVITRWGELVAMADTAQDTPQEAAEPPKITAPPLKIVGTVPSTEATPRPRRRFNVGEVPPPEPPADDAPRGVMARFKAPPKPPAPVEQLPAVPERDAIAKVMGSVRTKVQQCYDQGMVPGTVDLTLTVAGQSGKVKDASVSPTTSTASCVLKLARALRFPRFAQDEITIRYPYAFR